jgi:AraC-like DNA-binding protein
VDAHERWITASRCFGPSEAAHDRHINPHIVRLVLDEVSRQGGDVTSLLTDLAIDGHMLSDPAYRLSYVAASEVIRRAALALDSTELGLMIGMRHHIISWGFVGLGAMACTDMKAALAFGLRHQSEAWSMLSLRQCVGHKEISISARPLFGDVRIERILVDGIFVAILNAARFIGGHSLKPLRVELVGAQVDGSDLHHHIFQCPVHFSSQNNRLVFDHLVGERRIKTADVACQTLAQSIIDQQSPAVGKDNMLHAELEDRLRPLISNRPTQAEIAEMLGMSERTLRRQLRKEGYSYKEILAQLLRTCSLEQIVLARRPAEVVAKELGFANLGRLSQAYRQWTGQTLTPSGHTHEAWPMISLT